MTKAEQKKAVQFTRMCKFWRTNECKMGADCTFAHTTSELRPSPKPCFEFSKTGSCKRGQACRFVHSADVKKSKGIPGQSSKGEGLVAPMIRPVGPADVTCSSSTNPGGQFEMFDMPQLRQLLPPVEADFHRLSGLYQLRHDIDMRETAQGNFVHDFAQRDSYETAEAEHSGPSEVLLGFEGRRYPIAQAHSAPHEPWRHDAADSRSAAAQWLSTEPTLQSCAARSSGPQSFWI